MEGLFGVTRAALRRRQGALRLRHEAAGRLAERYGHGLRQRGRQDGAARASGWGAQDPARLPVRARTRVTAGSTPAPRSGWARLRAARARRADAARRPGHPGDRVVALQPDLRARLLDRDGQPVGDATGSWPRSASGPSAARRRSRRTSCPRRATRSSRTSRTLPRCSATCVTTVGGDREFDRIAGDLFRARPRARRCSRQRLAKIVAWFDARRGRLSASSAAIGRAPAGTLRAH